MLTLEDIFPPFALRIACGPVELRVLRDDDLPELVELVRSGIQACDSLGNHASAAVSRKTGYVENGRHRIAQQTLEGRVAVDEQRVLVTPATYMRPVDRVNIDGADALRRFLAIKH